MKRIITHLRPHLDDICAAWLLKRYQPGAADAAFEFQPADRKVEAPDADPETAYVGVGRGRFDEHKGDVGECATSLVHKAIKGNIADPTEAAAVARLVAWVLEEDTGKLNSLTHREFTVPMIIQGEFDRNGRDSVAVADLGFRMLEALLVSEQNFVRLETDWAKRQEFPSRFGRAVALVSTAKEIDSYGYAHGFDLVVFMNPDGSYRNIRGKAGTAIDLTPVRDELAKIDPQATWYFHHSKKMLICGGELAPAAKPSQLAFEKMIEIVK